MPFLCVRPIDVGGFSRETPVAVTTNIERQEFRQRQANTRRAEHPCASSSDDVECFFAILHEKLGNTAMVRRQFKTDGMHFVKNYVRGLTPTCPSTTTLMTKKIQSHRLRAYQTPSYWQVYNACLGFTNNQATVPQWTSRVASSIPSMIMTYKNDRTICSKFPLICWCNSCHDTVDNGITDILIHLTSYCSWSGHATAALIHSHITGKSVQGNTGSGFENISSGDTCTHVHG